jgi:ketosteroid isomerase-like protein
MSTEANEKLMHEVMEAMARGETKLFADAMADDFVWTFPSGGGNWSGSVRGKENVRKNLIAPLFAQFEDRYQSHAVRITAAGEVVVIECRGKVATRGGNRYDNAYCYVCLFEGGKIKELIEYMDTALAERVLAPPGDSLKRSAARQLPSGS